VFIASPEPDQVDKDEVLKSLPVGEKIINVVKGGLSVEHAQPDNIVMANISVLIQIEAKYTIYIISVIALIRASSPGIQ